VFPPGGGGTCHVHWDISAATPKSWRLADSPPWLG
jgi:hypothetical protein